jgi:hypothetical protein
MAIDEKIEKLNDFNQVPAKPELFKEFFKSDGVPERH